MIGHSLFRAASIAGLVALMAGCAAPILESADAGTQVDAAAPGGEAGFGFRGARSAAADRARAERLRPLIARHASANGLPFALADAVVRVESRYNAGARNGPNLGLTQINAGTARALGYQGGAAGLFDPDTNLRYGFRYLARAYELADGDTCGTILRYQSGHRAQTMTRAARTYCAKVQTLIASSE